MLLLSESLFIIFDGQEVDERIYEAYLGLLSTRSVKHRAQHLLDFAS